MTALSRFLAERWVEWDQEDRPLIVEAYRIHLAGAVRVLASSSIVEPSANKLCSTGSTGSVQFQIWPRDAIGLNTPTLGRCSVGAANEL